MKRKFVWLMVSSLVVLSMILTSCAPAAPATPKTPTTLTTPTTPVAPTAPTAPTPEKVASPGTGMPEIVGPGGRIFYKAGVLDAEKEKPKYGGVASWLVNAPLQAYGPVIKGASSTHTIHLTNDGIWTGDWAKGPAGSKEATFSVYTWGFNLGRMMLAESYELVGNDTFIFKIRKGIHYGLNPNSEASRLAGGRELTAYDVARSLQIWYFDPEGYYQIRLSDAERMASFEATDKYTLKVKFQPGTVSATLKNLSTSTPIFPPEVYEKYNKMRSWKDSVGTGPFMLTDAVENSSYTFVRNSNYWFKDPVGPGKGSQLPYLDGVKLLIISDVSTQQAALRTGKIDIAMGQGTGALTWENAFQFLKSRPDIQYMRFPDQATGIALRVDKPELPWYNLKVRQALIMAVDYKTIIKDYFKGNAEMVHPIYPDIQFMPMYTPLAEQNAIVRDMYTYQPEKAKKMLAEAGYPNGFTMEVLALNTHVDTLSILKDYLAKIGVDLKIDVRENAVFTSMSNGFAYKHTIVKKLGDTAPYDDPPTDSANLARVFDPWYYRNYEEALEYFLLDEPKIWPMKKEFYQWYTEQAFHLDFPAPYIYNLWQPWVKNYHGEVDLGNAMKFRPSEFIWIDQALKKSMGF
ncbi:MAG: ABC transporter substrate-binding protein [Chloroflexi bacterium]|nr:ABC transporter substrate-binding protein [Chloroflexota bacterium]